MKREMPMKHGAVLLSFWQLYRGRKAAIRRLRPFIERSRYRLGPQADDRWSSDFGLGYLATLITLASGTRGTDMSPDVLGLIQIDAWAELTGLDANLIGTRITLLSLDDNLDFVSGCRAAFVFDDALGRALEDSPPEEVSAPDGAAQRSGASLGDRGSLLALWDRLLDGEPPHID